MAKEKQNNPTGQTSLSTTNSFNKGMVKDMSESFMPEGTWYHARNLVTNSNQGDLGVVGNEPSNIQCVNFTYTFIGAIPIVDDYWAIFSTDDSMSEVGLFKEQSCEYYIISRDAQWNFKRSNVIIGVAKANFDCSYQLYWADGLNPDRTLNIGDITLGSYPNVLTQNPWPGVPYICTDTLPGPCENCEPNKPLVLAVERTRLAALMKIPCVTIQKGYSGGQLPNGSYYATIAYSVNQQRVSDYFNPSQVQPLFSHENLQGALDINFSNLDTDNFNEFQLVIVSTVNQQTVAKIMGYYNTQTNAVSIDFINPELESVPIQYIPLRSPAYEKSESVYSVNNYMIRTAPTGRFDFNYQPLANQIETNWVLTEYPVDYYEKGGNETGYMRDEQYCFWIRWVYNTGERSSSYHIPGRKAFAWEHNTYGIGSPDNIEYQQDNTYTPETWEVVNTAYATTPINLLPPATAPFIPGLVIAKGKMGYWQSTETYPADKPDVWNATQYVWAGTANTDYNLCGLPIRHHKMPSDFLYSSGSSIVNPAASLNYSHVRVNPFIGNLESKPVAIRLLGVEFENIKAPVDNDGNIIPGIVGYEILRSNRQGNRTIIAKGIINNMRSYRENTGGNFPNESASEILYPNYVGNYLGPDFTLSNYMGDDRLPKNVYSDYLRDYKTDFFTFHSPDTTFQNPFLSGTELKLYGELGHPYNMRGEFEPVPGHPKEKLITNVAFIVSVVLSIGHAAKALRGDQSRTIRSGGLFNAGITMAGTSTGTSVGNAATVANLLANAFYQNGLNPGSPGFNTITNLGSNLIGQDAAIAALLVAHGVFDATGTAALGTIGSSEDIQIQQSDFQHLPNAVQIFSGIPTFAYYWATRIDALVELIKALIPYRDYVYRSISHLDLSVVSPGNVKIGNTRRWIKDSTYLENQFTILGDLQVNNLYRPKAVGLQVGNIGFNNPQVVDSSVQTIGSVTGDDGSVGFTGAINYGIKWRKPSDGFFRATASCYYAGIKVRYRNQYGQIESPKQIPAGCVFTALPGGQEITDAYVNSTNQNGNVSLVVVRQTPVILGGDVYIGRYTEKNTFFYFYDWLYKVVNGTELDYKFKYMINTPRFYADFTKYDISDFFEGIGNSVASFFSQDGVTSLASALPNNRFNLDTNSLIYAAGYPFYSLSLRFGVNNSYMYLFQSGIRDFFVESEYNVDHRDWGELPVEKIYDPYGYANLKDLFDTEIIKADNYYKYDISLGLSKVYNSYISWGNTQDRSYDPFVAETCYTYFPNRVIYSLPANEEDKKDYWRVFLVNNYNDFIDKVTAFKSINKNGAIILFENSTPLLFNAVDQLQTVAGTKITIGDGGLFSQPLQTLNNADIEFQHGSCQDRLSVINTPAGIYWMSASQGKVFTVADGMMAISDMGLKWWFSKYLKFFILEQFPDFDITANPVFGVGCQSVYDNDNGLLYFCKKDYRLKPEYLPGSTYIGSGEFSIRNGGVSVKVKFRDPQYFEDVSWTISFDTKTKVWLSFHDWHPEYALSSIKGFNTTQTSGVASSIWKHGNFTNSFCKFYGVDYPFTIDYVSSTGQTVNTTRSVEYLLESYVYDTDGIDRFQILDYNFDEAIIYNTEQTSGLLNLNPTPKNNAPLLVNYPIVNPSSIDILYSKEEQKIRFNQFWDITNNRGEFFAGVLVQQPIWNTELNGYVRVLNPANLNYAKPAFERKKFRHYLNHLVLTKKISNNVKMLLKIVNNKLLNSPR
jgi:hypothetical protein